MTKPLRLLRVGPGPVRETTFGNLGDALRYRSGRLPRSQDDGRKASGLTVATGAWKDEELCLCLSRTYHLKVFPSNGVVDWTLSACKHSPVGRIPDPEGEVISLFYEGLKETHVCDRPGMLKGLVGRPFQGIYALDAWIYLYFQGLPEHLCMVLTDILTGKPVLSCGPV